MAYEFFDDVAFYFVICAILFTFLAPWSCYKFYCMVYTGSTRHKEGDPLCLCEDCSKQFKQVSLNEEKSKWTCSNIVFGLLWLVFILLMIQLPNFKSEELHSFQPFDILGIDKDATDSQIKKAYRSASLKWHPDKNPDNPEAEQNFIMVAKAYQTLTDPAAKENLEKYGNPDGYKGASVTIGLPSILTKKENELAILLLYFLVLIVIPPISVWMWWSQAKNLHSSGIYRETIAVFFRFVQDRMAPRFLIEILAAAVENRPLADTPTNKADMKKLLKRIEGKRAPQKWKKQYVIKATALLYGYILRVEVPESLQNDLNFVLKDVHRLLSAMLEITFSRRFHTTMLSCIKLMQSLTQALWFNADPLLQLPHLSERDFGRLRSKSTVSSIDRFKKMSKEQREKLCPDVKSEQWEAIDAAAARLPSVHVDAKYTVEDEEGVYVNDVVTVTINLTRMTVDEVVNGIAKEIKEEPEEEEEEELTEEELIERLPISKKRIPVTKPAVYAYAPMYPYDKKEQWYMYLMERIPKGTSFLGFKKVATFDRDETVTMYMRVTKPGLHTYAVHICCDSYIGCDRIVQFQIKVGKTPPAPEVEEDDEEDSDDEVIDPLEYSPIWDYIVLVLLLIFAYNWLQSKGYWAMYVTPIYLKLAHLFQPVTEKVYPVIQPAWDPMMAFIASSYDYVANILTRDFPPAETDEY